MIQFQISAPASLSIFGEHANNSLRSSIDLRTTLNFQELNRSSKSIEINFPQINLFHKIPLQGFLRFYDNCVENMELIYAQMLLFMCSYTSDNQRIILQIFYYLLIYIIYEEQIEIKTFRIDLSIKSMHEEFLCLASVKVCLATCLLHWRRLQKGIQNTFDDIDLKKIRTYATRCENTVSELDIIDIMVCTYGSMIQYEKKRDMCKVLYLPRMTILLVDLKQQDVEARNQQMTELKSMLPDITNSILNNIDVLTNMAADTFKKIFDIYKDNKLGTEIKHDCFSQQYKVLEICTRMNQKLLQMLDVSCYHLHEICAMAQKYGLSAKYTDFGNGRYAYIWCPSYINIIVITSLINELNFRGFDVILTNLFCTGVKIE